MILKLLILVAQYLSLAFCLTLLFCRTSISLTVTPFSELKAVTLLYYIFLVGLDILFMFDWCILARLLCPAGLTASAGG